MFFDINKNLCDTFPALDPIKLLDYPAVDVFDLIVGTMDYNRRRQKENSGKASDKKGVIRKQAGDNWF